MHKASFSYCSDCKAPLKGIRQKNMQAPIQHTINHQTFWLSATRTIFWEQQKALILSDLHFGKTGHFRKAGIAIPQNIYKEDLQRLVNLLQYFKPQQIIAVGDLFHSKVNLELDLFKRWRNDFDLIDFYLVKGNHDILKKDWYIDAGIKVMGDFSIGNIRFIHQHCETDGDHFTFCGHIHPGIEINGLGKQSLRFPCFYFTNDHCILPAYSKFTGMATIYPSSTDAVYAIVEDSVIKV
jgi:DNA ligase-associated metallophosphoesterase